LNTSKSPGLLLIAMITFVAMIVAPFIPGFGTALVALAGGMLVRQLLVQFDSYHSGVSWAEKYVLETAIVLIGFGLNLSQVQQLGSTSIILVISSFIVLLVTTLLLQKLFRETGKLFWLLGAGSAICGSAAIGATAPIVRAKQEETGISLAVINVLGLLGMVSLPLIARVLNWGDVEMSLLLGGILQSMGHVVGVAYSLDDQIGQIAIIIKMARIAFLIPFLLIVYFIFKKNKSKLNARFPIFIIFFAITAILSQTSLIPDQALSGLATAGELLLTMAMVAIGLKINLREIFSISGKALLSGSMIFLVQIVFFSLGIMLFMNQGQ